jgi:hypothetical protein
MASLAHERTSSYITIFMVNTYRLVILTIPATLFLITVLEYVLSCVFPGYSTSTTLDDVLLRTLRHYL